MRTFLVAFSALVLFSGAQAMAADNSEFYEVNGETVVTPPNPWTCRVTVRRSYTNTNWNYNIAFNNALQFCLANDPMRDEYRCRRLIVCSNL